MRSDVSHRSGGFSLLEVVIATALTTMLVAGVFALVNPTQGAFATEPEVADMQQRLRVAVDTLRRDLATAGAGADIAGRTGSLIGFFAPLLPFREGEDAIGTVRTDTVTAIGVPATAAQTTLAADLLPGVLTLQAVAEPGCSAGTNLCGFSPGLTVAIYDAAGTFGVFTVAAVADAAAQITLTARSAHSLSTTYRSGSNVVQVRVHTFTLKSDPASQTSQLMHADGSAGADVPVVDHVVALAFAYDAEPRPPSLLAGTAGYGPSPPPIGVQTTAYPPGENCAFQIDPVSGEQVPRLPALAAGTALVPLTAARLGDGPWCPDETNGNRWDADLLRIRAIDVTIRVEAALSALRGPAGLLFTNGGSSNSPSRWAADQQIRFRVSPRNMNPVWP
jgi:Tfp pilus assembly protein PilW